MSRARASVPLVALASLALAGCPGDDIEGPIDASAICLEARNHADLDWLQDNVFTGGCSNFVSCHKGAATQAGRLSLERGRTHDSLVNQPSTRFPTWKLVVPGDPAMSYQMVVLGQYPGPLDPRIGTMPYNSRLLCQEKRDAIERWIVAGAPDSLDAGIDALDAGIDAP